MEDPNTIHHARHEDDIWPNGEHAVCGEPIRPKKTVKTKGHITCSTEKTVKDGKAIETPWVEQHKEAI